MVRIRLKGVNHATKRLADGTLRTYWYAWRGGPLLRGKPGTPEFIASYNEAVATKAPTPQGALLSVLQSYQASGEFNGLAARTRRDYVEKDQGDRSRVWRFPAVGADRSTHSRHLPGVARSARRQVTAAGGLCVAGARACVVMGARSRARLGESMCTRRSALSRFTCRSDLDGRRRGRLSQIVAAAFASAAIACVMDRCRSRKSYPPGFAR
jgi:hypothetical protein